MYFSLTKEKGKFPHLLIEIDMTYLQLYLTLTLLSELYWMFIPQKLG